MSAGAVLGNPGRGDACRGGARQSGAGRRVQGRCPAIRGGAMSVDAMFKIWVREMRTKAVHIIYFSTRTRE